jgi:hypothetical protein
MGGAYIAHFGRRGDYATLEDTHGKKRPCVRHPEDSSRSPVTAPHRPAGYHESHQWVHRATARSPDATKSRFSGFWSPMPGSERDWEDSTRVLR